MTEDWTALLPAALRERAVALPGVGTPGVCFSAPDALEIIEHMCKSQELCLGGDEWLETLQGLRPSYENWYVIRARGEAEEAFKDRSWREADAFVRAHMSLASRIAFSVGPYHGPKEVLEQRR